MNTNDSNHPTTITWDAHACPTLELGADLSTLYNYKDSGFTYISLNIGFDPQDINGIKRFSQYVKEYISTNSQHFVYVDKPNDVIQAKIENKLAIGFDIEGISPLLTTDSYINTLNKLGVKQLGLVYNKTNLVAGGCNDTDTGLTSLGKNIVKQLNKSGIIIDCSHMGEKSSLEVISTSDHPVIFSHSNSNQLHKHPRNISNTIVQECSKKGGVIGINGINIFHGGKKNILNEVINNIEYLCSLVGDDHVGLGLDYVFDHQKTLNLVQQHPESFSNSEQYKKIKMIEPHCINEIINQLLTRSFSRQSINKILGGNFHRVARIVWKK